MDKVKWEYKILPIRTDGYSDQDSIVAHANKDGSDGWEMCGVVPRLGQEVFLWFKRIVT